MQPSTGIVRAVCAEQDLDTSAPKGSGAEILTQRFCTSGFKTWRRDLAQEVLQDCDTSAPKGS